MPQTMEIVTIGFNFFILSPPPHSFCAGAAPAQAREKRFDQCKDITSGGGQMLKNKLWLEVYTVFYIMKSLMLRLHLTVLTTRSET